jgi:heme exporter protein C
MHGYANPARFLKFARPATGWVLGLGLVLLAAGVVGGLFVTPPD